MTKIKATEMVELQYYARETYGSMPLLCVRNNPPTAGCDRHDLRVWHPKTETMNISHIETVEHLPDCTGWDCKPTPTYAELHSACGLKVGDRVKVIRPTEPEGWDAVWNPLMNEFVNKTATIVRGNPSGFVLDISRTSWRFPCTSLEKVEAKYRPFANAEEFTPHRDKWLKDANHNSLFQPGRYGDLGVYLTRVEVICWDALLKHYPFEDGTPCGVLVEQ